jgi:type I restriction enzyme, S subunit
MPSRKVGCSDSAHLPEGWKSVKLRDVAVVQTGIAVNGDVDRLNPVLLPYLRVANVQDGRLDLSEIKQITLSRDQVSRYLLKPGDVLMTEGGDFDKLGRGTVWQGQVSPCLHQNHIFAVRTDQDIILPSFLAAYSESRSGKRYFLGCSKQTTNLASINSTQLKDMPVILPPITEQRKIMGALSTWDQAIGQAAGLLAAKRRRFEAARIHLIEASQADRGESGWRTVRFGEITEELKGRNSSGLPASRVMGVIKGEGLVPMRSHVMASDLRRYLMVPPKAFAYNPMRLNIGSIAQSGFDHDVVVSPDYVVFQASVGLSDPDFMKFFVGTKRWRDHLGVVGSGSVRTRIYFDGLGEMVLRVPHIGEQRRIGEILTALERDVKLTADLLDRFQRQKRGLIEKLLLGEWRITIPASIFEMGIADSAAPSSE